MSKYRFVINGNKIIALSTFAGKPVRGVAKCDPEDNFDLEAGKELAKARCSQKIAEKRYKRATKKFDEACAAMNAAEKYYNKMYEYYSDSAVKLGEARVHTVSVLNKVAP